MPTPRTPASAPRAVSLAAVVRALPALALILLGFWCRRPVF